MVSTPILIGGTVALAGGAYLLSKRATTGLGDTPSIKSMQKAATNANSAAVASLSAEVVENVIMDAASEEYNMARERYRMIVGAYPPKSWSLEMINAWITEQSRKEELLNEYVVLVSENSNYLQQQDTAELTYQQLQSLIEESKRVINSKKSAEAQHRAKIAELCDRFITEATAYPGIGAATLSRYKWDESMLMEIKNLSKEDKQLLNEIFLEKTNGEGIKCCAFQAEAKSNWKYYKSIPEICDLTINSGKTAASRNGAWACREVVAAYKSDMAGADGSRSRRRTYKENSIIAFHLQES